MSVHIIDFSALHSGDRIRLETGSGHVYAFEVDAVDSSCGSSVLRGRLSGLRLPRPRHGVLVGCLTAAAQIISGVIGVGDRPIFYLDPVVESADRADRLLPSAIREIALECAA